MAKRMWMPDPDPYVGLAQTFGTKTISLHVVALRYFFTRIKRLNSVQKDSALQHKVKSMKTWFAKISLENVWTAPH